jgi:hypothetical protein
MIIQKRIFVCLEVMVDLQFADDQQYHPEEDDKWKAKVSEELCRNNEYTVPVYWTDPNGTQHYLEYTAKPLFVLPMIT